MLRSLNRVTRIANYALAQQPQVRFQHAKKAIDMNLDHQPSRNVESTNKQHQPDQSLKSLVESVQTTEKKSFAKMLKESKFIALGNMENKFLIGKIVEVLGDDLYIDYGGKFHCVCKRPTRRPELYVRNANVKIKLLSFEMSAYFLNAARNITLLESDAVLVELYRPDVRDENETPANAERREKLKQEIKELNADPYY